MDYFYNVFMKYFDASKFWLRDLISSHLATTFATILEQPPTTS